MKAMMLTRLCTIEADTNPLTLADVPMPKPQRDEVLIKAHACGVCHTELDDGVYEGITRTFGSGFLRSMT